MGSATVTDTGWEVDRASVLKAGIVLEWIN
jgi:hypothetical protein